jgi:hypothetical protein
MPTNPIPPPQSFDVSSFFAQGQAYPTTQSGAKIKFDVGSSVHKKHGHEDHKECLIRVGTTHSRCLLCCRAVLIPGFFSDDEIKKLAIQFRDPIKAPYPVQISGGAALLKAMTGGDLSTIPTPADPANYDEDPPNYDDDDEDDSALEFLNDEPAQP